MYTTPLNCSHSQVLRSTMAARTDPHTESQGVEFLIVERYVSNNHAPIMNLRRHTCVYVWVCVSSLLKGILFVLSHYCITPCKVLAVTNNPSHGVTQYLLGYTAEFTSKIRHGGGDMTASNVGHCFWSTAVNMVDTFRQNRRKKELKVKSRIPFQQWKINT